MGNWYVVQVRSGREEKIINACHLYVDASALEECFLPRFQRMKKIRGQWQEVEEVLFPGYLFFISDDVTKLYQELKKIPDLTKLLGKREQEFFPLPEEEVAFLKSFGKEDHVVDLSIGYIEGEKIMVTSGPMKGKEGLIRKIDRHKRLAFIEVEFLGELRSAKVGLEIISKS